MTELQELAYREAETTGSLLLTTSLRPGSPEPYVRSHASAAAHIRIRTLSLFKLGLSNASVSAGQCAMAASCKIPPSAPSFWPAPTGREETRQPARTSSPSRLLVHRSYRGF